MTHPGQPIVLHGPGIHAVAEVPVGRKREAEPHRGSGRTFAGGWSPRRRKPAGAAGRAVVGQYTSDEVLRLHRRPLQWATDGFRLPRLEPSDIQPLGIVGFG